MMTVTGDVLVTAAGVPPHVLVDPVHFYALETSRIDDQSPGNPR
ncbi:hypothetical protein [Mycobacterium sp. 236(2023)]|nr:hypothetical protein [Mycobacterium sp. 236(2023)]MDG4664233.1 hypothetical protein [Mycobacterium sp. 236(2023)]